MGIALARNIGDEIFWSSPSAAAFNSSSENDFSRMDAFNTTSPPKMSKQKAVGRLDRCHFGVIFDRELQHVAIPIEVFSPLISGHPADTLPGPMSEAGFIPGSSGKARDTEVDTRNIAGGP